MTEPRRHSLFVPNTGSEGKHEIVFYDWGPEDARDVVVCVHGLTRNARDFDFLAQALIKNKRRVLCLSMAGRGESAWLADPMQYNYATYIADCIAILNNFHLRSVDWIGTSMGGIIGMMIAATMPGRIRKLVLNDIGVHMAAPALQRIYNYLSTMPRRFESQEAAEMYLGDIFKPFNITDPVVWRHFIATSLHTMPDGSVRLVCDPDIAVPVAAQTNNFTDMRDISLGDVWEKVLIPTLVVRGAESDILDATTVDSMRRTNPKMQSIVIPDVGHAPMLATPDQYQRVIDWLVFSEANLSFL